MRRLRKTERPTRRLLLAVAAALVLDPGAAAATWSVGGSGTAYVRSGTWEAACEPGSVTVSPLEDAQVGSNFSDRNWGSHDRLNVGATGLSDRWRSLLKFPVVQVPQDCSVASATLTLTATQFVGGRVLSARPVAAAWTEGGVTWNNQPGVSAGEVAAGSGSTVTWDVTGIYVAAAAHGYRLSDQTEGTNNTLQTYRSREAGGAIPALTVSWS